MMFYVNKAAVPEFFPEVGNMFGEDVGVDVYGKQVLQANLESASITCPHFVQVRILSDK